MPMIDSDKFKVLLDAVAAAEGVHEAVHADWKKMDAGRKRANSAEYSELMTSTERGYLEACRRLAVALQEEVERAAREG